ncbi:unnamed protein product, partial [Meganyctiphanes norvegica]
YGSNVHSSQCNQAIMLVTDGAPESFQEIFERYNRPHVQVRMFTYQIGKGTHNRNLKQIACYNKGFFVHVTNKEEAHEQVLKYITVMARPMVMYQMEHPLTWTGVYADIARPQEALDALGKREGYRLKTTVSVPVFDTRRYF